MCSLLLHVWRPYTPCINWRVLLLSRRPYSLYIGAPLYMYLANAFTCVGLCSWAACCLAFVCNYCHCFFVVRLCVMVINEVRNSRQCSGLTANLHRDVPVDCRLPVGMQRLSAASDARTTEMPWLIVAWLCVMVGNAETERCFSCQNHRDALVDCRLPVRDGGEHRDWALLQLPEPQRCTGWLSPACGNAETERCFRCQNHRDALVDCRLPVCDGGERRDWALLQMPEPQRCPGWLSPACAWWWGTQRLSAASVARTGSRRSSAATSESSISISWWESVVLGSGWRTSTMPPPWPSLQRQTAELPCKLYRLLCFTLYSCFSLVSRREATENWRLRPHKTRGTSLRDTDRLQSLNSLWYKLRKDRLSASKVHSVKTRPKNFDVLVGQLKKSTRVTQAWQMDWLIAIGGGTICASSWACNECLSIWNHCK